METVEKNSATGMGRQTGVRPVLQGGDIDGPAFWVGVMGDVRRNDEGGGGHPCWAPTSDHRE